MNPAFCGMFLWELKQNHHLNDYQICKYHNIKSGLILYGTEVYIFTQITNNDILSYVRVLFRDKNLPNSLTKSFVSKMILKYIRYNATRTIIPSIPTIQKDLFHSIGVRDSTFVDNEETTYLIFLHMIYLMMFMIHYRMPLRQKILLGIETWPYPWDMQLEKDGIHIFPIKNKNTQ